MTDSVELISEPVLFYVQEFYCFDNFSAFAVVWRGSLWMTAEHAYQASKFEHISPLWDIIRDEISAHQAKKTAETYKHQMRRDWLDVRLAIMEEVLRAKLAQHEYVRRKLLETGERRIIESSPDDSFWGWGPNKDGENHLGRIWMKLRGELREGRI
ncbi:MAG: hypothetical protein A3J55_04345 [Candidatus Ryanbacteria bacterium RIFCSPHIGHO2_02_FULL_45_17b]|uniref:NADAR domain-containing protein n=1 Tax=Candidatus Ryanbacteria bacterium RIFCSPHIGHO2_01_FULL_45_22 TaxID=1802114 RepID=A0A1G2G2B4_9BACT|nr:MAG: hypothetical protein A2719_04920 [Candidatus Ryanbacteria bacterium RIFCSPHIGHO2_01_FULL_45_22]OGZ47576.1 MAG: hypothetical protein A3J55_04345 [Candidatus Ryanbacteria bacterium RIFCSPHIGHO2_02_FULL_45_17b]